MCHFSRLVDNRVALLMHIYSSIDSSNSHTRTVHINNHQTVSYLTFSGVFCCKASARRSVHSPQDHFIITLIISDRSDWRDTRGKCSLARNPDRSWWHRHTNWKFFWPQPLAPWTTGPAKFTLFPYSYPYCLNMYSVGFYIFRYIL